MKINKLLAFSMLFPLTLCSCNNNVTRQYSLEAYISNLAFRDQFLICHLGDLHFSTSSNLERDFEYLRKVIYSYAEVKNVNPNIVNVGKPALIIINGDTFMNATKDIVIKTFEFFDSLEIPYAFNYGNHDLQGSYTGNFINNYLLNNDSPYNMYRNPYNDNVFGNSNYVINLVNPLGQSQFQIFLMDSNCFYYGDYDSIHEDQIAWYQRMLLYFNGYNSLPTNIDNNTFKKSMIFTHIPLLEFGDAINSYHDNAGNAVSYQDNYCNDLEEFSPSPMNSSLFDTVLKYRSTVSISANHNHTISSDIFYKKGGSDWPVRLIFGEKTTTNLYCEDSMVGATFYNINENLQYSQYNSPLYFNITKVHVPYEGEPSIIWQNQ